MKNKNLLSALPVVIAALFAGMPSAYSADLDIKITNLTHAMHFTPLLISAHDAANYLFHAGQPASSALQAMAEGGDISLLEEIAQGYGAVNQSNPAGGLLAPTQSIMVMNLDTGNNDHLSIVAMVLPTNDGFTGLDGWPIPTEAGTYTLYLNAYDAGTEANDEIVNGGGAPGVAGIPAIPGEDILSTASGVTSSEQNQTVHIHRGNVGDTDADAGISDLDSRVHRWLNPVAKVVITVKYRRQGNE